MLRRFGLSFERDAGAVIRRINGVLVAGLRCALSSRSSTEVCVPRYSEPTKLNIQNSGAPIFYVIDLL